MVTAVITVNEVDIAIEPFQIGEHERRDQITAVDEQRGSLLIGQADSPFEVGNMVMAVGENGDTHNIAGLLGKIRCLIEDRIVE